MAALSSVLAWESPWAEEPDGLQSMGLQRVGHDLVTEQQKQPLKISEVRQSSHHGQGYREGAI